MSRRVQVACALLAVVLIMGGTGLAAMLFERVEDVGQFTRDPTAVAGVPWWIGAVSRLTNLCWAVAAAANVLAAQRVVSSLRRPLLLLGLFCTAFAIDDTMLVHEAILPWFGIPGEVILGVYAVAGLALGWWWLRSTGDVWVRGAFFVGAATLAVSLSVDTIVHGVLGFEDGSALLLVEDGAKLLGVVAWAFCGAWALCDGSASPPSTVPSTAVDNGATR